MVLRHPELLADDLVTWEPEARRGETKRGRPRQSYLSMLLRDVGKHKRGTANPDAGQGYMEEDTCGRLDVAPT